MHLDGPIALRVHEAPTEVDVNRLWRWLSGAGVEEPSALVPETIDAWIQWVEQAGEGYFVEEGAYVRYGMPCRTLVRRTGAVFVVSSWVDGDGMGGETSDEEELDREGLRRMLQALCRTGRPVLSRRGIDERSAKRARGGS
jgi:hypothetical protein